MGLSCPSGPSSSRQLWACSSWGTRLKAFSPRWMPQPYPPPPVSSQRLHTWCCWLSRCRCCCFQSTQLAGELATSIFDGLSEGGPVHVLLLGELKCFHGCIGFECIHHSLQFDLGGSATPGFVLPVGLMIAGSSHAVALQMFMVLMTLAVVLLLLQFDTSGSPIYEHPSYLCTVSNCIEHDITSYVVLKLVEVEFQCGTCRYDICAQCWVHRFNAEAVQLGARVMYWAYVLERQPDALFWQLHRT